MKSKSNTSEVPQILLNVVLTGGGISFLDFMKHPGASRRLYQARIPYSTASIDAFLGKPQEHYCSVETTAAYYKKLEAEIKAASPLVVNCSLSTDREKRGTNRIFIAFNGVIHSIIGIGGNRYDQDLTVGGLVEAIVTDEIDPKFVKEHIGEYTCHKI